MNKVAIIDYVGIKGGNHYYSLCLLDALAKHGYETYLYSNFDEGINKEQIHFKKVYKETISKSFIGLFELIYGTVKASYLARKNKVRSVIFHLFEASPISGTVLLIFKLFGLKTIGISHDVTSFENNEKAFLRNFIYSKLLQQVIVHNQFSYEFLEKVLPAQVMKKTKVIKHGGHTAVIESIPKGKALTSLNLDPSKQYVLFFGQIKTVKGLDILLEAFPNNPENIHLIIAGKPWKDDFNAYQQIIDKRGISDKVHLLIKYISEEERDQLYNAADFIVLPYREIFQSGVLLMAMSYGLPIIASDLPANKEILDANTGLLFKSEDENDLRKKIELLSQDANLREQFRLESQKKINTEYAWEEISKQYFDLISIV